ncbi:MAG: guanylate kinase [Caulobacteraceae bacterium]
MRGEAAPMRRGLMLVISSPSGAGKTSLCRRMIDGHPALALSISCTTRAPRAGERDGHEYHFVSPAAFQALIDADAFLEWAEVHEHRYGTPREAVMARLAAGEDVLFDVDWQGAAAIAAQAPADTARVFILPPSLAELAARLRARAEDAAEVIERRLLRARSEIAHWPDYDWVIVNEDFEKAYLELICIYDAERLRPFRNSAITAVAARLLREEGGSGTSASRQRSPR